MKVKLIEYPFGKQLPGCDQDIVWFIKTVDEDNHAMTCFWYQDKPLFVSNFDLHIAAYKSKDLAKKAYENIVNYYINESKKHPIKVLDETNINIVNNYSKDNACSSYGNSERSNWSIGTFASDPFGVSPSSWNSF